MKYWAKSLLLLTTLWASTTLAASYSVKVKGRSAGRAELTFTQDAQQYAVKLGLYPIALAKVFGIDDMIESAKGSIKNGQYQPKVYQRQEIDGKKLLNVVFSANHVKVNNKKGNSQFDIHPRGQDPLSQIAQIKHDLASQSLADSYYLVTDSNQRQYLVKQQTTSDGYHVELTEKDGGERVINLWFDAQFELQRMEKRKRGKSDFDMRRK